MKKLLLTINFEDSTDKFWWDSGIKNKVVDFDPEKETIHQVVARLCDDCGMEMSYKGKPQGNIYRDLKSGESKAVGYMYRGKGEVHDRNMPRPKMVFWDIWVTIQAVEEFAIEELG